MQSATEAGAGEAADEGEEEDADADDTKYGLVPCHSTAHLKFTSGCPVWKTNGRGNFPVMGFSLSTVQYQLQGGHGLHSVA